jgi:hypothetical protein
MNHRSETTLADDAYLSVTMPKIVKCYIQRYLYDRPNSAYSKPKADSYYLIRQQLPFHSSSSYVF